MLFIDNPGVHPAPLNLALEEHLLRHLATPEDVLLLYVNPPAVIIGRNQNAWEEADLPFLEIHHIDLVRRLSGGGAVYHDEGNLNFSFITPHLPENVHNFRKFTAPVIQVLRSLGVPAELGIRNDIRVLDRKVSGNAQYIAGGRMMTHGTLLYQSDLDRIRAALRSNHGNIQSKAVQSVPSQVANIAEFIADPPPMDEFRARLVHGIASHQVNFTAFRLSEQDWQAVHHLAERYRSWDWNFGGSPDFHVQRERNFPAGNLAASLQVKRGIIFSATISGSLLSSAGIALLERCLPGLRYTQEAIRACLLVNFPEQLPGSSNEEIARFLSCC